MAVSLGTEGRVQIGIPNYDPAKAKDFVRQRGIGLWGSRLPLWMIPSGMPLRVSRNPVCLNNLSAGELRQAFDVGRPESADPDRVVRSESLTPTILTMAPTTGSIGRSTGPMPSPSGTVTPLVCVDGSDLCELYHRSKPPESRGDHLASRKGRGQPSVQQCISRDAHRARTDLPIPTRNHGDDYRSPRRRSLACRSWYIVAVPHIHRTLILREGRPDKRRDKLKPLSKLHELGLAPLANLSTPTT